MEGGGARRERGEGGEESRVKLLRLQSGTHCFAGCGHVVDLVAFIYVFILLSWHILGDL